jgi:hypothetical protein
VAVAAAAPARGCVVADDFADVFDPRGARRVARAFATFAAVLVRSCEDPPPRRTSTSTAAISTIASVAAIHEYRGSLLENGAGAPIWLLSLTAARLAGDRGVRARLSR